MTPALQQTWANAVSSLSTTSCSRSTPSSNSWTTTYTANSFQKPLRNIKRTNLPPESSHEIWCALSKLSTIGGGWLPAEAPGQPVGKMWTTDRPDRAWISEAEMLELNAKRARRLGDRQP